MLGIVGQAHRLPPKNGNRYGRPYSYERIAQEGNATRPNGPRGTNVATLSSIMPVTVTVYPERRLTITTAEGVVTDEEFLRAREQLLANPAFDPDFDRLWDFFAITEAQVSETVVAQLVATSPNSDRPICRAIVVSERATPMKYILDFMNRVRQANRRIAAFPDRDSAEKWIAVTQVDFSPA